MIKKFDKIALIVNIPEYKLRKGDIGEVILVCDEGKEFEIKFKNIIGEAVVVIRLIPGQFRKIDAVQIPQLKKFNLN
jgi:hypothetical protein